jgi:hypothetical protein
MSPVLDRHWQTTVEERTQSVGAVHEQHPGRHYAYWASSHPALGTPTVRSSCFFSFCLRHERGSVGM